MQCTFPQMPRHGERLAAMRVWTSCPISNIDPFQAPFLDRSERNSISTTFLRLQTLLTTSTNHQYPARLVPAASLAKLEVPFHSNTPVAPSATMLAFFITTLFIQLALCQEYILQSSWRGQGFLDNFEVRPSSPRPASSDHSQCSNSSTKTGTPRLATSTMSAKKSRSSTAWSTLPRTLSLLG